MRTNNAVEILANKLYWISDYNPPQNQQNAYFFCIDQDLVYEPFFVDFGPLNLGVTYRFVIELENLLKDPNYKSFIIYHYTSLDVAKRANAAYLMCAYQVIIMKRSADEAWKRFEKVTPPFQPFRDASYGPCSYKCYILDVIRGLEYAIQLKWFNVRNFNLTEYQYQEKIENGDINVIIPEKFIAFSGPNSKEWNDEGQRTFTPEDYVPIFKQMGVTLVIRLNNESYEASRFTQYGIKHLDLYFLDGSVPSDTIVQKFLDACENEKGKIAVHCKAGLGRTGTLIGLYAMKHYHFRASDFIGYIRIVRPGSILGPQQFYLLQKQDEMINKGQNSAIWKQQEYLVKNNDILNNKIQGLFLDDHGTESPLDIKKKIYGDLGQGENLSYIQYKRYNY